MDEKIINADENSFCTAVINDKYVSLSKKYPSKFNSYYCLDGLLGEDIIHAKHTSGESHWIANWRTTFEDMEIGDEIIFKVQETELLPYGFVHDSKRVRNVRNISVISLSKKR